MSQYSPEYIGQVINYISGDVVSADEFNGILNKLIQQGDHNTEWLNWLDTVGIPAAVAEITLGDIREYIQEEVASEIDYLTQAASERTTGWTTKKRVCFINTNSIDAVIPEGYTDIVINNLQTANLNTSPASLRSNPVFKGYSGTVPTALTPIARTTEFANFRTTLGEYGYYRLPVVYYPSVVNRVGNEILRDNIAAFLYNDYYEIHSFDFVWNSFKLRPNQFPVYTVSTVEELDEALANASINDFLIIASGVFGTMTSEQWDTIYDTLDSAGFVCQKLADYLMDFYTAPFIGKNVYALPLKYGRLDSNINVTSEWKLGTPSSDELFTIDDIMVRSKDKLTFAQTNNKLDIIKGDDDTAVFSYEPIIPEPDDTLVGTEQITPEVDTPVLVASAGIAGSTNSSKTCDKLQVTADGAKCSGEFVATSYKTDTDKAVPYVVSYDEETGTLVLGGF